eukprot:1483026-Pyramimonas_sp.AAC.1
MPRKSWHLWITEQRDPLPTRIGRMCKAGCVRNAVKRTRCWARLEPNAHDQSLLSHCPAMPQNLAIDRSSRNRGRTTKRGQ